MRIFNLYIDFSIIRGIISIKDYQYFVIGSYLPIRNLRISQFVRTKDSLPPCYEVARSFIYRSPDVGQDIRTVSFSQKKPTWPFGHVGLCI